jgi:NAD(P)H dehydrogenase (quinone)
MSNRILVSGASGTIGSALVAELSRRGADFAVLRSRPAAGTGAAPVVVGDFAQPETLAAALRGFDTLFLLLPLVANKVQLARNALQAARAAGIGHVVRSSGAGADPRSPLSIARLQGEIDQLVKDSGMAWTILRPTFFMQNHVTFNAAQIRAGTLHAAHADGATAMIDVRDIAEAAAAVLTDPAAHAGKSYDLTGGEALTDAQQMAAISEVSGRPVRYVDVPAEAAREAMTGMGMPPVVVDWLASLNEVVRNGWGAGISDDVRRLTGHAPRRFAAFARDHAEAWQ